MSKTVFIKEVQCISVSSGTNAGIDLAIEGLGAVTGAVVGGIGGAIAIAVGIGGTTITGGTASPITVPIILGGAALAVGGALGGMELAKLTEEAIKKVSDGEDDLYIKVNGDKVYPSDSSVSISPTDVRDVDQGPYEIGEEGVVIELYDWDFISSDDLLHRIRITDKQEKGVFVEKLDDGSNGSIYRLTLVVR